MSRWEVEMTDGSKRVVEAATEKDAMAMAATPEAPKSSSFFGDPVSSRGLADLVSDNPAETPDQTSYVDRLKWGMAHGPASLMGLVAKGVNGGLGLVGMDTPATDELANAPWYEAGDEAYKQVFGGDAPEAPRGFGQKFVGSLGSALSTPAPASKSLQSLLGEGVSLLGGTTAGTAADEAGLPWWAQVGISGVGATVPSMGVRAGAARMSTAKARTAAEDLAERLSTRPAPAPGIDPSIASPGVIHRAASEFKAMMPEGHEAEAIQRLDDTLQAFPDPRTRPVTSQALGELGGETVESATMSLTKGDRTVSRNVAGQKLRAVRAVDDEYNALLPEGDMDTAQAGFEQRVEKAATREENAWRRVPLEAMPRVPTASLGAAADDIAASAGKSGAGDIPGVFDVVRGFDEWEPFSELQALRSKLLRLERAGRKPMATEQAVAHGMYAGRLRQNVEQLIDDVAENNQVTGEALTPGTGSTALRQEGVDALRKAHRITRENRELFRPDSKFVKAMENPSEANDIASAILTGGPKESAQALEIFKNRPKAQASTKAVFIHKLVGPDILTEGAAKQAMKRLREKRNTAVALLGADHVNSIERVLRKAQQVRSGRAGTRAGALGTGSANLQADAIALLESGMESVGQRGAVGATVNLAKKQTIGRVRDALDHQFQQVLSAALLDPELARDLLSLPDPAAIPKWAARMESHMARNGIRLVVQDATRGQE